MLIKFGKYTIIRYFMYLSYIYSLFCLISPAEIRRNMYQKLFRVYKEMQNLQLTSVYENIGLQYFATIIGNFTNVETLFVAVLVDFHFCQCEDSVSLIGEGSIFKPVTHTINPFFVVILSHDHLWKRVKRTNIFYMRSVTEKI